MTFFEKVKEIISKNFGDDPKEKKREILLTDDLKLDCRNNSIEKLIIENQNFLNIDFSYSSFYDIKIINCNFVKCIFEKVEFEEINEKGNKFVDCLFINSHIKKSYIGYLGTLYSKCEFLNCKFSQTQFIKPYFEKCIFDSQLKNIDFFGSTFEDCIFKNKLKDVWFRGDFPTKSNENVFGVSKGNFLGINDFSKAQFNDLTFSDNCKLNNLLLPKDNKYRYFENWNLVLIQLVEKAKEKKNIELIKEAEIFFNAYAIHAKKQPEMVINIDDIKEYFPDEIFNIFIEIPNKLNEN